MDALIAYLQSTGTGASKLALIERTAKGRAPEECVGELVAALNAGGHAVTAGKVLAYVATLPMAETVGTVGLADSGDVETTGEATDAEETAAVAPKVRRRWTQRNG